MDVLVMGNFFLERKEDRERSLPQRVPRAADEAEEIGASKRAGIGGNHANQIPREAYAISHRLEQRLGAEEVYLFGSHARGDAGPDSDLDFMVIVPQSEKSRYQRAVDALYATDGLSFAKDIIVMTRAEWERDLQAVCSLASTVKREGIALHGSS